MLPGKAFEAAYVLVPGFEKKPEGMFDVLAVVVICLKLRVVHGLSGNEYGFEFDPYNW